eukprot:TRINITY_DN16264_c0_g1_i2.p1 TRINITY_DN16264_c0_g1~~TRINITY_DN16264_c0_g1_i2.p1  ORF type:complete len:176 (-),score=50.64 TRINITY_DN16264_c0_g1_i2:70-540(-)
MCIRDRSDSIRSYVSQNELNEPAVEVTNINLENFDVRTQRVIQALQTTYTRNKKQVTKMEQTYIKLAEGKSPLENLVRETVETITAERQNRSNTSNKQQKNLANNAAFSKEERRRLINALLSDERVLSLLREKQFTEDLKRMDLSQDIDFKDDLIL